MRILEINHSFLENIESLEICLEIQLKDETNESNDIDVIFQKFLEFFLINKKQLKSFTLAISTISKISLFDFFKSSSNLEKFSFSKKCNLS